MNETFQYSENPVYKLRSGNHLRGAIICTACIGSKSVANLGAKIWNLVPEEIKASNTVDMLKSKTKR